MKHNFLEGLVFCNLHALSLVTGEADRHAQWESLNFATLTLAVHFDHGNGDVRAWQAGNE